MGHIGCARCGKTIKDDGSVCPHCSGERPPPKRLNIKPWIGVSLFGGVVYFIAVALGVRAPENGSREAAFDTCRQFVTKRLKAPATAQFPRSTEAVVNEYTDKEWGVKSHVDSQNGFGALLRTQYDCTVKYEGGTSWRLVALKID